jgi:hypothetical protein
VFLSKIPTNLVGFCGPFLCLENIDGSPAAIVRFNAAIGDKAGNGANELVNFSFTNRVTSLGSVTL